MQCSIVSSVSAPKGWFVKVLDTAGNLHELGVRQWSMVRDDDGRIAVKSVTWDYGFKWFAEDRKGFRGYRFAKPSR